MSTSNNSENYGTASESAAASEFTTSEPGARVKKKGGMGKVIGFVLLIVIALGVAFLGYTAFIKKKPAPQRPAQTSQAKTPAAKAPPAAVVDPAAPAAGTDPLANLGLENGAIPATDPALNTDPSLTTDPALTAAPGTDPLAGIPGADMTKGVVPNSVVTDPTAGTPSAVATPAAVVPAPAQPSTPSPGTSDPLAALDNPAPAPAPIRPSAQPVASSGTLLAEQVGDAVTKAIQPLSDKVDRIEGLVASHSDQIRQLQVGGSRRPAVETTLATAPRPATIRSSKPKPKPKAAPRAVARPAVKPAPRNTIEVLSPVEARPQVVSSRESAPAAEPAVQMQKARCQVHSMLEGRAWMKQADGSFMSYAVGDQLPDGKSITSISPDGGIRANGQAWDCPR